MPANYTASANCAIKSISIAFHEPQKAITDALSHLLTLIQHEQACSHELSARIHDLEQRHQQQVQVQQLKDELKRELQEGFQQQYDVKLDNLAERLAASEKDNHALRQIMQTMEGRHNEELLEMEETMRLMTHNLGFSPNSDDYDDDGGGDGEEQTGEHHRVDGGPADSARTRQNDIEEESLSTNQKLWETHVEQDDIQKEADGSSVGPDEEMHAEGLNKGSVDPNEEKHPEEINEQSATVPAVSSSEKGAIIDGDKSAANELEEEDDDVSLGIEDGANDIDKALPGSKHTIVRPRPRSSASLRSSMVIKASQSKVAFHETLVSRLKRLEDTYDEIVKCRNDNDMPSSEAEYTQSTGGSRSTNYDEMKDNILKLEREIMTIKSRLGSIAVFLVGCINADEMTNETPSDTTTAAAAPTPTLSSILQEKNKIIKRSIDETNERVDALSSRLVQSLAQRESGTDSSRNSGSVDPAAISILEQKVKLLSDRILVDQNTKCEPFDAEKDGNHPAVLADEGWKHQVDKNLAQLEREKADSSQVDSMLASLEDKCNESQSALVDAMRKLGVDGFTCGATSNIAGEASEGSDVLVQEALCSVEVAQATVSSLQKELEGLVSKLDDKPSLDEIKALMLSVESTYKDRFASHEALQAAIDDIHQGLKQKMARSDVSCVISKSIEKARLGLTEERDSLMIGRAPYRCIGCNNLYPGGVSNAIATKVNHNALPTPSIGFGRLLHARRYFHVRDGDDDSRRAGGGVIRARPPRRSGGTIYARR